MINNNMTDVKWRVGLRKIGFIAVMAACSLTLQAADPISSAVDATVQANKAAAASQQKINQTDDQTKVLLDRYRSALWQTQQMSVYAKQLEQLTAGQDAERASLERQLREIDRTEQELLPLILRMLTTLEKFVALDLPFLKAERQERLASIKKLVADPSASMADKYRRVIEAYQIEADYGRSLGVEREEIGGRIVDILRVGRTGLYSITVDGKEGAFWNREGKKWDSLEREHLASIRKGIKIARETAAADFLILPMPAAAGAQP